MQRRRIFIYFWFCSVGDDMKGATRRKALVKKGFSRIKLRERWKFKRIRKKVEEEEERRTCRGIGTNWNIAGAILNLR